MSRKSTRDNCVTIAIDTRRDVNSQETAKYHSISDILPLLILLQDLCGDQTQVFFDFGVISLINVDLTKLRERFEGDT